MRIALGLCLLIMSVYIFFGAKNYRNAIPEIFFGAKQNSPSVLTIESNIGYILLTMGSDGPSNRQSTFRVNFPSSIVVNDTVLVRFSYLVESLYNDFSEVTTIGTVGGYKDLQQSPEANEKPIKIVAEKNKYLDFPVSFEMSSSGFDIAPQEKIIASKNTDLPFIGAWTISPKSTGKKSIIIKMVEEERYTESESLQSSTTQKITLNNRPVEPVKSGFYSGDIVVTTHWGISERAVSIITGLIALVGFVLVWKPLEERLRYIVGEGS